jgi:hypothetical protein
MKNITKILSLVLVFALLALALVSCGEKPEDRVAKAMAKMATAKQTDSEVTITVKMDIAGTKTEIPMTMKVQSDMTDEKNPVVYTETNTTVMGQSTKIVSFYKDGYVYAEADGVKVKMAMSYEEMMENSSSGFDASVIFDAKKDSIDQNFVITENEDGTLSVKMTVTKEEFASELEAFSKELTAILGTGNNISFEDTVFEFTVGKDNTISAMNAKMNITMNVSGQSFAASYDMNFKYNPVGEGFTVTTPSDLSSYKEVSK